jgi:predicted nucleotidyltransferase
MSAIRNIEIWNKLKKQKGHSHSSDEINHHRTIWVTDEFNLGLSSSFLHNLKQEFYLLRQDLAAIKESISSIIESSLTNGGENMEEVLKKIEGIDSRLREVENLLGRIDERTKKLDQLPLKTEVEKIVVDEIRKSNLATGDFVESKINSAKNHLIGWLIATGIGMISAIAAIVRTLK